MAPLKIVLSEWSDMVFKLLFGALVNLLPATKAAKTKHSQDEFHQIVCRYNGKRCPWRIECEEICEYGSADESPGEGHTADPANPGPPASDEQGRTCRLYLVDFRLRKVALIQDLNQFESLFLLLKGIREGSFEPTVYHLKGFRR